LLLHQGAIGGWGTVYFALDASRLGRYDSDWLRCLFSAVMTGCFIGDSASASFGG
jgi:hypothetical protein